MFTEEDHLKELSTALTQDVVVIKRHWLQCFTSLPHDFLKTEIINTQKKQSSTIAKISSRKIEKKLPICKIKFPQKIRVTLLVRSRTLITMNRVQSNCVCYHSTKLQATVRKLSMDTYVWYFCAAWLHYSNRRTYRYLSWLNLVKVPLDITVSLLLCRNLTIMW